MNRHRVVLALVVMAAFLGWGFWGEVRAHHHSLDGIG